MSVFVIRCETHCVYVFTGFNVLISPCIVTQDVCHALFTDHVITISILFPTFIPISVVYPEMKWPPPPFKAGRSSRVVHGGWWWGWWWGNLSFPKPFAQVTDIFHNVRFCSSYKRRFNIQPATFLPSLHMKRISSRIYWLKQLISITSHLISIRSWSHTVYKWIAVSRKVLTKVYLSNSWTCRRYWSMLGYSISSRTVNV